jgi:hypothetical protein
MKTLSILSATLLAATAFAATAAEKQAEVKAPILMSDAQMKEVVAGGVQGSGPTGHGICTATYKAGAPGAIRHFNYLTINLPGNGNLNSKGNAPGFGLSTAGKDHFNCLDR